MLVAENLAENCAPVMRPASIVAALAEEFRRVSRIKTNRHVPRRPAPAPAYLSARVTSRALIETGDYAGARETETVLRSAPEDRGASRPRADQQAARLGQVHRISTLANSPGGLTPTSTQAASSRQANPTPAPAPDFTSFESLAPVSLGAFDLPLSSLDEREAEPQASEPFDIFEAALQRMSAAPEPSPMSVDVPPIAVEPPPMAFESATIAFEAPVVASQPDPHVAAGLVRLERFLGAIHTARHA